MPREIECVIWCSSCRIDKFEVWRVPTPNEQAYENEIVPADVPQAARQFCGVCATRLERKPSL